MSVEDLEIHGAVAQGGKVYTAGDEEALAEVLSDESARYLCSKDVISCRIPRGSSDDETDEDAEDGPSASAATDDAAAADDASETDDEPAETDDEDEGGDEDDDADDLPTIADGDLEAAADADVDWSDYGWEMEGYAPSGYLSRYGRDAKNSAAAVAAVRRWLDDE